MALILILEDEIALGQLWAEVLSGAGHTVHLRSSVKDALQAYQDSPADVVISDLRLGGSDADGAPGGFLFLSRMWAEHVQRGGNPPCVIAVSGARATMRGGGQMLEFLRRQKIAHLALEKPFSAGELVSAVDRLLAGGEACGP